MRVGDLLARPLELVCQVVLAEVSRAGPHQRAVGDHSQGALPVFEPVGQRLGCFGEDLAVNSSGPEGGHHQQHRDGGSQRDAAGTFLHPSQRPSSHQQRATGREAHPGRATLGQQQAVGDQQESGHEENRGRRQAAEESSSVRLWPGRVFPGRQQAQAVDQQCGQETAERIGEGEQGVWLATVAKTAFPELPGRAFERNSGGGQFGSQSTSGGDVSRPDSRVEFILEVLKRSDGSAIADVVLPDAQGRQRNHDGQGDTDQGMVVGGFGEPSSDQNEGQQQRDPFAHHVGGGPAVAVSSGNQPGGRNDLRSHQQCDREIDAVQPQGRERPPPQARQAPDHCQQQPAGDQPQRGPRCGRFGWHQPASHQQAHRDAQPGR